MKKKYPMNSHLLLKFCDKIADFSIIVIFMSHTPTYPTYLVDNQRCDKRHYTIYEVFTLPKNVSYYEKSKTRVSKTISDIFLSVFYKTYMSNGLYRACLVVHKQELRNLRALSFSVANSLSFISR